MPFFSERCDFVGGQRGHNRTATDGSIQRARRSVYRVPQSLGLQSATLHFPEQVVVRIDGQVTFGPELALLPVGGRIHDQTVQILDVPAVGHKSGGQPVQQFGVRRRLSHGTKVIGSLYDASTEVPLPDPVHKHPGCQRMIRTRQPQRQLFASPMRDG